LTQRDLVHHLGIAVICPIGGFIAFAAYLLWLGSPDIIFFTIIWVVAYPIAAIAACAFGLPLVFLQARWPISAWVALPAFLLTGTVGGALVYAVLFGKSVLNVASWNERLTFEYTLIGIGVSVAAWFLSVFGPLRLSGLRLGRGIKHPA
jgi:hypothetical protein